MQPGLSGGSSDPTERRKGGETGTKKRSGKLEGEGEGISSWNGIGDGKWGSCFDWNSSCDVIRPQNNQSSLDCP